MPKFLYKAVSIAGETSSGSYFAQDRAEVINILRTDGYFPISIKELGKSMEARSKKLDIKDVAGFCSQIGTMLKAGVPIAKTLEILHGQLENKELRRVTKDVYDQVQKGISLSEAFQPHSGIFPNTFMNMLESGEASGTLEMCMERAGETYTRNARMSSKIKSAMVYPMVLLALVLVIVAGMFMFVIPQFATLYESSAADLPGLTQALINISEFVRDYWYIVIGVVVVIVVGVKMFLSTDYGRTKFDAMKLRFPVISKLIGKIYASRYARTLSALNTAGVPLIESLNVTARSITNRHIEKKIYGIVDEVVRGQALSVPLERADIMPPMIVYMTKLGEESGMMDSLLEQTADYYDHESEIAIQTLTSILEPGMIVIMAAIIVPILFAILLPVFNMHNIVG